MRGYSDVVLHLISLDLAWLKSGKRGLRLASIGVFENFELLLEFRRFAPVSELHQVELF